MFILCSECDNQAHKCTANHQKIKRVSMLKLIRKLICYLSFQYHLRLLHLALLLAE